MIQFSFFIGHDGVNGWDSGPNSAGGVSVKCNIKNLDERTIKYAYFEFVPYNAVGDLAPCTIRRKSAMNCKFTGPLAKDQAMYGIMWENCWYNSTISKVLLTKVLVEYMDGTTESIVPNQIQPLQLQGGCYVATAVYGSYDCPQVWTLRRYRDNTLAQTWYGRAFIRTYYAVSPTLVKWFGNTAWFRNLWKGKLDRMVASLQRQGVESTPYDDRVW